MNQPPIDLAAHRKRRAERERVQAGEFDAAAARRRIEEAGEVQAFGPADVPCARCGKPVAGNARRCVHCGVHFSGTAGDLVPGTPGRARRATLIVAVLAVVCLVLAGLLDWMS